MFHDTHFFGIAVAQENDIVSHVLVFFTSHFRSAWMRLEQYSEFSSEPLDGLPNMDIPHEHLRIQKPVPPA